MRVYQKARADNETSCFRISSVLSVISGAILTIFPSLPVYPYAQTDRMPDPSQVHV